jgi:hypothetical protein
MVDQGKTLLRRIVFRSLIAALASLCLILVSGGLWPLMIKDLGDYTKASLDQSPFLRDVEEPITLIRGHHEWKSDQLWDGVTFMDGRRVERYAEYVTTSYAPIEIHNALILGKVQVPALGKVQVPARGREELAFLGLLQRWCRQDAEARELTDPSKAPDFFMLTEQQQAKVIGVRIMRMLLKRN